MTRGARNRSVLVFLVVLAAGLALGAHLDRLAVAERRRAAEDLARGSAFALERELSRSLASAATLAALVRQGATAPQLDAVAEELLALHGGTANLQLAQGNVISRMWPLDGNQGAIGFDLITHPEQVDFIRRLMETRRPVFYGPFTLVQGGTSLAIRVPVLVRQDGVERYWGAASAIIRVKGLLEESRIRRLSEAGFDWALVRTGRDGARELLASSFEGPGPLVNPVSVPVETMGQAWSLEAAPRAGWRPASSLPLRAAGALLVALLAGLLAYRVLALPELLRREVEARTRELEEAHQEQRRAEEAQRQSQKLEAIGQLAGGVAHDFNNLLSAILGHAELLTLEVPPGTPAAESATTISLAAQRAADLTRQLLAFARLGHQRQEEVDLHAAVREVAGLLGRTLDKAIEIELRLEAARHLVRGDPGQLQQVILNLAVNARDAMPAGGRLILATALEEVGELDAGRGLAPGRYLVLSVTDTGAGIPREHLERIFEPFFTTKPEGKGSGLGLATVYGIVRGHGGAVRVYSEVGAGSRFMVYLPALAGRGTATASREGVAPRGTGLVLVVDDEALVRTTAGRMLQSLGYQPVLMPGGAEAVAWLEASAAPPALVLLDLAMPGMDGLACFRALRARQPGLRVVVSSGFARDGKAQQLLDEGAVGFVQKPYRLAELARALAAATAAVGAPA